MFYLERHETNPATGLREDVWIKIDPAADLVREKRGEPFRQLTQVDRMAMLCEAGLVEPQLYRMDGQPFAGGVEDYVIWLVAQRPV